MDFNDNPAAGSNIHGEIENPRGSSGRQTTKIHCYHISTRVESSQESSLDSVKPRLTRVSLTRLHSSGQPCTRCDTTKNMSSESVSENTTRVKFPIHITSYRDSHLLTYIRVDIDTSISLFLLLLSSKPPGSLDREAAKCPYRLCRSAYGFLPSSYIHQSSQFLHLLLGRLFCRSGLCWAHALSWTHPQFTNVGDHALRVSHLLHYLALS